MVPLKSDVKLDFTYYLTYCGIFIQAVSFRSISRHIQQVTQMRVLQEPFAETYEPAEPYQILNYGMGGEYKPHNDEMDRIATFMIFLNEVKEGGATVFTRSGVRVKPVQNSAILWYNYLPSGELDERTEHAGR